MRPKVTWKPPTFIIFVNERLVRFSYLRFLEIKSAGLSLAYDSPDQTQIKKVESGWPSDFFDKMKVKKTYQGNSMMEHLFKFLLLAP